MLWNYRILQHPNENGQEVYGIHEVHYENGESERPVFWSEKPLCVGNSVKELLAVLEMMRDAVYRPILNHEEVRRTVRPPKE